jgi:hypothetical protein
MLLAQTFARLVHLWSMDNSFQLPFQLLKRDVLIVLFQTLNYTLKAQCKDGSWDGSHEKTAYAILTINFVSALPIMLPLLPQIKLSQQEGKSYLRRLSKGKELQEYLWIEKISYSSRLVSKAYTLAALKCSPVHWDSTSRLNALCQETTHGLEQSTNFFGMLPVFSSTPKWHIQASLLEGLLYAQPLRDRCNKILSKKANEKRKHLDFIPFTWTVADNATPSGLGFETLLEMMVVSVIAFDIDLIMEAEVASLTTSDFTRVTSMVLEMFTTDSIPKEKNSPQEWEVQSGNQTTGNLVYALDDVERGRTSTLTRVMRDLEGLVGYYHKQSDVVTASGYDRKQLKRNLRDYLVAHLTQIKDKTLLEAQSNSCAVGNQSFESTKGSFFVWIRDTSGNHTGGIFAFSLYLCLVGPGNGRDCFDSVEGKYIAQDVCRHLASLCRTYNDYGSIIRDRDEQSK